MLLKPEIFKLKEGIKSVFGVPKKNTLCTNSLDNALTLMTLDGQKIKYSILAKDFTDYISEGTFIYFPVFSTELIAYVQKRVFHIYDMTKNEYRGHLICETFPESIVSAEVVGNKTFFLKIRQFSENPANMGADPDYILKKYEIDFRNARLIKQKMLKEHEREFVNGKNIFICDRKAIAVYDLDFGVVEHPIAGLFDKDKTSAELLVYELVAHPILPFAIMVSKDNVYLIEWRKEVHGFPVFPSNSESYEFSPDQNWLIYWQFDDEEKKLYAMKVNPESKTFFDLPVFLGAFQKIPDKNSRTWMPDPMSYVIIDKGKQELVVWKFEK